MPLEDGVHRVYFASRDDANRSHIGWVELDLADAERPRAAATEPVLAPGRLGCFDDHGVYAASLVAHEGTLFLYYVGWNPGPREPLFYASIGLAASDDGGLSFRRHSAAPVLARSDFDPCLVTSPCVLLDEGRWRMWYVSGFAWREDAAGLTSYYDVKYAESADGVNWERDGRVCIGLEDGETNIGRPCVLRDEGGYRMWFASNRGEGYRIGYAESDDGLSWRRVDGQEGLEPSGAGWDSQAVAYPWVFANGSRTAMLYNGNEFGRDGFGLAVEEDAR
jgi:predicted GH43/DUF377 family glycosyl hydrolase